MRVLNSPKVQNHVPFLLKIEPKTIIKEIRDLISNEDISVKEEKKDKLSKKEKVNMIDKLTKEMNEAAKRLDFERAMELRDIIFELECE